MKIKQEVMDIVKKQISIEYNCSVNDLTSSNNVVTVSKDIEEGRHFINGRFFFQMVTFGDNAVITANESIHDWLKEYIKSKKGHILFEHNNLLEIEKKLNDYNKKLYHTHHMFLSHKDISPKNINYKIKWFENEEIHQFYETKMFPNAFCTKYNPKRPDVLAVAAYDEDKIIGMAGCSADTPLLWQIGIDVNEKYCGRGIGTGLVILLKNEIEKRGKIPYYGTSLSNIYSWSIALNSGFTPVWIEIETIEEEN